MELRRRVHAGLNKGEARNALARAVFFNRLGEIRDRSFEQQRYRASGLNLVTAAVVLWNTVYLERAAHALRGNGHAVDDALLQYLSPLGWEHINLTPAITSGAAAAPRSARASSGRYDRCNRLSVLYLMRWSLPPSQYYAEDRLSFGEPSWKTLRLLVSIWVRTLSIFIVRIIVGRPFTVKNSPDQS
ncbi:Tn3 family transposase [Enterobacter hormaechei]|uniref:Tn3 family transposase n=1 Tax=Enterobacter hormaechei TaxID=158836 RepID=UPI00389072CC